MATIDEVKVAITADTKGLEKGITDSKKQIGELGTSAGGLGNAFAKMRDVMLGPVAVMKELGQAAYEAMQQFADAELSAVRLGKAVENNPLMSGGAADRLADFSDELQKTTLFEGDATKAIVSNLAAMGMSEDQIKKLVKVAMDYASATGDSLDSAVTKLNATLQGSAGQLGRQNAAIRSLTEEELKNGKAIDILAKQYEGFAEKVGTTTTGRLTILKAKWGDFIEGIGESIATTFVSLDALMSGDKVTGLAMTLKSYQDAVTGAALGTSAVISKTMILGRSVEENAALFKKMAVEAKASLSDMASYYEMAKGKTDPASKAIILAFKDAAATAAAMKSASDSAGKAVAELGKKATTTAAAVAEITNAGKGLDTTLQPLKLSDDEIKKLQDAQRAIAEMAGSYVNMADAEIALSNAEKSLPEPNAMVEGLNSVTDAIDEEANSVDYLAESFDNLAQSAQAALMGGVTDLFHAMDVAGSNMGDIWGAAAQSFEEFMVRFIDNLPALLLQAGLQLIGVGQWSIGLAMIAAAGGVALVDALTTSDAEQRVYGTGKYSKPEAAPTTGASKDMSATSTPSEDTGSYSGVAGTTVNIYGVRDTSPAALRREMDAAGRQLAFMTA